jgi:hypothetical protein
MQPKADKEKLQRYLRLKENHAQIAKEKGMKSTYANLLLEIDLVKSQLKKFAMGSK